jgi:hypothetical protein
MRCVRHQFDKKGARRVSNADEVAQAEEIRFMTEARDIRV